MCVLCVRRSKQIEAVTCHMILSPLFITHTPSLSKVTKMTITLIIHKTIITNVSYFATVTVGGVIVPVYNSAIMAAYASVMMPVLL